MLFPHSRSTAEHKINNHLAYCFRVQAHHATIIKNGSMHTLHVVNYLLILYLESSKLLNHARKLFDEIPNRDIRSWTILISGLSRQGHHGIAFNYFTRMQMQKDNSGMVITPNAFTLSAALKSCTSVGNGLRMGKMIHGWIVRNGILADPTLNNTILDLYAKFRMFDYVNRWFESMGDERDFTSWNILMVAKLRRGELKECLDLFWRLPIKSISSWNTIIDGFLQHGFSKNALELLYQMVQVGARFNGYTFSMSLVLASSLKNLGLGRQIHCRFLRIGANDDAFAATSLLDMYCKCGEMGKALQIFRGLQLRLLEGFDIDSMTQTVSWSTLIAGYVQHGMIKDALACFNCMIQAQLEVDPFTLTTIVTASADSALLDLGQQIHAHTLKLGHGQDLILSSSLIDMYAKCGNLEDARLYFRQTKSRNIVVWSAMISSYAMHGQGKDATKLFELMQDEGIRPNAVTFIGLLNACSHAGMIEDGCRYFKLMIEVYRIQPDIEHFACMVDLFGRAGHFKDIENFVYEKGIHHLKEVWKAYLSSCWLHKNVKMVEWVSKKLLQFEPHECDPYLLLSNTYSANHVWGEAAKIRGLVPPIEVTKHPGKSWVLL